MSILLELLPELEEARLDFTSNFPAGKRGRYAAVARGLLPLLGHDLMHVADAPQSEGVTGVEFYEQECV